MMRAGMIERTGTFEELQRRRQVFAKYQPGPEARTVPVTESSRAFRAKITALEAANGKLQAENDDLQRRVTALRNQIERHTLIQDFIPKRSVRISDVINDFVARLNREGQTIEDAAWTADRLCAPHKRTRGYVIPRHICLWIARRICTHASLPELGRVFRMDHTSVMHGVKRAAHWMDQDEFWERVARETLEAFGEGVGDGSVQ